MASSENDLAISSDLTLLFEPRSIAVVGASSNPEKLSGRPHRFLDRYGYDGDVYLVNPNTDDIDGRPCYDRVQDIPNQVDLAMVLVPARLTPQAVADCGKHEIPFAVVIASGFSETDEGEALEAELVETARENGIRIVGPNSEGVINLSDDVPLSFSSILKRDDLEPGGTAFVTQSGAFGGALFQLTQNANIGSSKWVSTGNEADITTVEYLNYLVDDPDTDTIVTYVESIENGQELLDIGRRAAETDTDILAMRVGSSPEGQEAAASHTGSVATDDDIYDAIFQQTGLTRVWSVDEFVDTISACARTPSSAYPQTEGESGVGVVSMSGGAAVLIADMSNKVDLPLATLSEETRTRIRKQIPSYGSATNPVDVTASAISNPDVFNDCIEAVMADNNVTGLVVQFGNSGGDIVERFKHRLVTLRREYGSALATVFTGSTPIPETQAELRNGGVLVFEDPVRSVRTMKNMADRANFLRSVDDRLSYDPDVSTRTDGVGLVRTTDWERTVTVLEDAGVPFAPSRTAASVDTAVTAAAEIGYPVAIKLNPLSEMHKSDVGGVATGLEDEEDVRMAFESLDQMADEPVVVQRMMKGVEIIVGVTEDPDFGPVMLCGAGGVFVELFKEFSYRALPVTEPIAREMIEETAIFHLLDGYRNYPPGNVDALASTMASLSDVYSHSDISELEINPILVTEKEAVAVDLLMN